METGVLFVQKWREHAINNGGEKNKTKFGHFKGGDCCWCLVPCMNIHTHVLLSYLPCCRDDSVRRLVEEMMIVMAVKSGMMMIVVVVVG